MKKKLWKLLQEWLVLSLILLIVCAVSFRIVEGGWKGLSEWLKIALVASCCATIATAFLELFFQSLSDK